MRVSEVSSKMNDVDIDKVHSGIKQGSKLSARLSKCNESKPRKAQKSTQKAIESSVSRGHQGGGVNNEDGVDDVAPGKRITRSRRQI